MKDFFTQCMKDLNALTGIEQVIWMQRNTEIDKRTGEAKGKLEFQLCVAGMIEVSKEFTYIPEVAQQNIIRRMMIQDKDYTSLNSRTIYKWLNMHKDSFFVDSNAPKKEERVVLTEDESRRIDVLADQYKSQLGGALFKPKYEGLDKEKEKVLHEDSERVDGKKGESQKYLSNLTKFVCTHDQIGSIEIPARSIQEAVKMFEMNFGFTPDSTELKNKPQ